MNLSSLVASQKKLFRSGRTLEPDFRRKTLTTLRNLIVKGQNELCQAVSDDFGKPLFEAYATEIAPILQEIDFHRKHLAGWARPQRVRGSWLTFPSRSKVYRQPYGNTLIIGAWNYPVHLIFMPLIGAISAGNTAVVKPSELTPQTSRTIRELIVNHFEPEYLTTVEGGAEFAGELLSHNFDYIFFTGSARVGKMVMKAASETLTPVTLELGGKSPAIVHRDADVVTSAQRIWWGKCMNSGQTCVAPDFVAVHKEIEQRFLQQSEAVLDSFYNNGHTSESPYTRIINDYHFQRLAGLLSVCEPVIGGGTDPQKRFIEPSLVKTGWDHPLMEDEIFGPILPLIVYEEVTELIDRLRNMPSPLALYLFSRNSGLKEQIVRDVPFGGGCINDTISHLGSPNLPFGGVGPSGMGSYHGRESFETFSYKKSILHRPIWPDPGFRYPPYSSGRLKLFKWFYS